MSLSVSGVGWGMGSLLWRDDFTQFPAGFPAGWVADTTGANESLQANLAANASVAVVSGQSVLQLTSKSGACTDANGTAFNYSGAQIYGGLDRVVPRGGYVEWVAEMPMQLGVWPTLWFMGNNGPYGGYPAKDWPSCGEVDVAENQPAASTTVTYSTLHFPNGTNAAQYGGAAQAPASAPTYPTGYNTWGVLLGSTSVSFYLNGSNYWTATQAEVEALGSWVFNSYAWVPFMSIYVGGAGGGTPPSTVVWPIIMNIQSVSAYSALP